MDVTSLLNQSVAASGRCDFSTRGFSPSSRTLTPEKPLSASLPTPSPDRTTPQPDWDCKSRTSRKPWSAGGYALPSRNDHSYRSTSVFSSRSASENPDSEGSYEFTIAERRSRRGSVDSTSVDLEPSQICLPETRTLQNQQNSCDDTGTPNPVGHKFSSSHSSLSSFASWRSTPHSRISSVTTLSGIHSTRQSVADLSLIESTVSSCSESYLAMSSAKRGQQSTNTRSLPPYQNDEMSVPKRYGSPSDAVLNMNYSNKPQMIDPLASDPTSGPSHHTVSPRLHNRAISAPDVTPAANYRPSRQIRAVVATKEAMAVSRDEKIRSVAENDISNRLPNHVGECKEFEQVRRVPEHQSEETPASRAMHTPPSSAGNVGLLNCRIGSANPSPNITMPLDGNDEEKPVCMFVDDCDTGSQLRKAISHLFGRNKTCTLKIPKMVWVYYCRKHYQRVRYRNARTYPVTQMELVETQIERLKAWSDENQARGQGAYIRSWTLSLRKREEKRLKGNKGTNEEDDDASAPGSSTHIPVWIIDELGGGFDTDHMFAIAARLREEIESGALNQVPEIEFLPDIVDDESEKDAGKPARHRRQAGSVNASKQGKRKAADFSVLDEQSPMYRDMSFRTHRPEDESIDMSSSGKRPRTARAVTFPQHQSPGLHGACMMQPSHPHMASSTSYGLGTQGPATGHPPRAQNIVPKLQPPEYAHRGASAATGRRDHQGCNATNGHARMSSCQGPQHEVSNAHNYPYNHHHHHHHHHHAAAAAPAAAVGYGHQSGQYTMSRSRHAASPPSTLPSIAAQMQGERGGEPIHGHLQFVGGQGMTCTRPQPSGPCPPPRPMHQRSASAYTPRRRFGSVAGRPTMLGDGDPRGHAHAGYDDDVDDCRPPPPLPTYYDAARQSPPGYGRHEWTSSENGHVPQHTHQHYGYGSNYVPPPPTERNAAQEAPTAARHKNPSAYPEPVAGQ